MTELEQYLNGMVVLLGIIFLSIFVGTLIVFALIDSVYGTFGLEEDKDSPWYDNETKRKLNETLDIPTIPEDFRILDGV